MLPDIVLKIYEWLNMHFTAASIANYASHPPYPEPVYTGWSSVHWNATGMPLVDPVYTGIPLGHPTNTMYLQGTLEHHWKNLVETAHTGGTPVSKSTGLSIFSLYLEFTALQWIPILLLTHVSTSTSLCACLWYEHHCSFCVFEVESHMKSVEFKQLSPYQLYT